MSDKPIIFSGPMVKALLDGRKTQTRRLMKVTPPEYVKHTVAPQEKRGEPKKHPKPYFDAYNGGPHWCWWDEYDRQGDGWMKLPYSKSDRLWVRENAIIAPPKWTSTPTNPMGPHRQEVAYCAECTDGQFEAARDYGLKKRPSIHMPRWASRLTLTVTDVRVQRLNDISSDDARDEGIFQRHAVGDDAAADCWTWAKDEPRYPTPQRAFRRLWMNIYGADSWADNPWIVALTFTVERRNIDAASAKTAEEPHA